MPRIGLVLALSLLAEIAFAGDVRERISIDAGWRFTKGDPTNIHSEDLLYDLRPIAKGEDQNERLAEATEDAAKLSAAKHPVLKSWILPAANPFIKDPAKQFIRPEGNPEPEIAYVRNDFDDSAWRRVNLPHDWAIEGPFNSGGVGGGMGRLPSPGVGWYRKKLDMPVSDQGEEIFLDVDGAMSYAAVWLNGKLVGGWPYGYAAWRLDLTPFIHFGGDNELAIRLDNPPDFSRWYPGAGIYRNVWLVKTSTVHIGQWGTYLTTPEISDQRATVNLKVTVANDSKESANVTVMTEIFPLEANGKRGSAVATFPATTLDIAPGLTASAEASTVVLNPKLWGPPPTQKPNRYVAITTVAAPRRSAAIFAAEHVRRSVESPLRNVLDIYETPFGIRHLGFKPNGLFINGERIALHGVNQHHDLGALGAAFNERAAERQLGELREMGCNAIRMSHNPPAPELLDLADRMGFLVLDEIFDVWYRQKTPFDFHLIFADWHEPDLRAFMRRDRNHPSVVLWSVGNEVGEQYTGDEGAKVARELIGIAHEEDSSRPATASMNFAKADSAFAAAMDVISLNYQGEGIRDTPEYESFKGIKTAPQYPAFHAQFPETTILSSESAAAFSSRGVYLFPVAKGMSNPTRDGSGGDPKSHQVSGYELYAADFGSSADKVFAMQDRNPYVAGEFVWSGWDYLGEPTPYYSSRSSYFGTIDLAGFKKDRFYLYQSRWRPDVPMAHILPHWSWPERVGQVTPVHVFTSGDEGELFLNGKSLGRKKKGASEYRLHWDDVVYQPGTLKVITYRHGAKWATAEVKTAGAANQLRLAPDRKQIRTDGKDLSFITVTIVDKDGLTVPRANDRIHFDIQGPGDIVATDNGDPTSFEIFSSRDRKAFNGQCLVIVRSRAGESGTISLAAIAEGLGRGTTSIQVVAASR